MQNAFITSSRYLCMLGLLVLSGQLRAQLDSNYLIDEVHIIAPRIKPVFIGTQSAAVHKLPNESSSNLAQALAKHANVFIKSQGPGNLSTSSIRGGSASHTLVLWNGFPIQSPLLGLLDLSLIPSMSGDQFQFEKGGGSSLWGSGAVAGLIGLRRNLKFDQGWHISANSSVASFGRFHSAIEADYSDKQISLHSGVSRLDATNDYSYLPAPGLERRMLTNSAYDRQNYFQDIAWKISPRQQIKLHFWHLNANTQIPPNLGQNASVAYQKDRASRSILSWEGKTEKGILQVKAGYFAERQNYRDSIFLIDAQNDFNSFMGELNWSRQINQFGVLNIGSSYIHNRRLETSSQMGNAEDRIALYGSYRSIWEKVALQIAMRSERIDDHFAPILPSLGLNYSISKNVDVSAKFSRDFRAPTLNDRFWIPGGNIELRSEHGWSQEVSTEIKSHLRQISIGYTMGIFSRRVEDWIIWIPANGGIWSPENISKVWSRGLEQRFVLESKISSIEWTCSLHYDYVKSTNEVALSLPKIEKGSQLIYTPEHKAAIQLAIKYKQFAVDYSHSFTSKLNGINEDVPAYNIGDLSMYQSIHWGRQEARFFFNLWNVWNRDYLIVERRPMPGRNIELGLSLNLNQNN